MDEEFLLELKKLNEDIGKNVSAARIRERRAKNLPSAMHASGGAAAFEVVHLALSALLRRYYPDYVPDAAAKEAPNETNICP